MRHFLHSQGFWTAISTALVVWIIYTIGSSAIAMARYNPESILSLIGPLGLMNIVSIVSPGFLPGILLVGALTMRSKVSKDKNRG